MQIDLFYEITVSVLIDLFACSLLTGINPLICPTKCRGGNNWCPLWGRGSWNGFFYSSHFNMGLTKICLLIETFFEQILFWASCRKLGWLPVQVFLCEEFVHFQNPVESHHGGTNPQKGLERNPAGKPVLITPLISTCNECFIIKHHYYIASLYSYNFLPPQFT